ncbi:acireductone synthase [Gloeocapsa sp. PCC 73106]|uniref:acireductone synthase n=1 Tax=Gloeocapsa sp. PCC 73106 TaxID=102232 RepID=UPI0002AC7E61|nr:acireductone synthase [Gloeocapsa sp. PCC 73106]ELR99657.1 2,3-diketo-5-methylthio-1-phosphopentane phosphatase [Gloeocapsa sp. PCC 73106]
MIRAIVTDIEGTTSSLSFVKDILFPYARAKIGPYLRANRENQAIQEQLDGVRSITNKPNLSLEEIISQLIQWIDEDQKITPLKTIQGLLWEEGYQRGDYQGHIYPDAVTMLRKWYQDNIPLYVYSSGSVYAQKLLFAHTAYGDLTSLFQGYFDTKIGAKTETESYDKIAQTLNIPPGQILFLSDRLEELDAAKQAGFQTRWLVREGLNELEGSHEQVKDFSLIHFDFY